MTDGVKLLLTLAVGVQEKVGVIESVTSASLAVGDGVNEADRVTLGVSDGDGVNEADRVALGVDDTDGVNEADGVTVSVTERLRVGTNRPV